MSTPTGQNTATVKRSHMSVQQLAVMGLLTAISIVLVYMLHFPIFPGAPFLEYDPADIPILFGTFLYGPVAGLILTVIVSVIQGLTVSAASGVIGIVMHIAATGCFVLMTGLLRKLFKRKAAATNAKTGKKAAFDIVALVAGVLVQTLVMVGLNLWLTPIFMGAPMETVLNMLLPFIIPFNLIKAGANAMIAFLLFKAISVPLRLNR